MLCALYWRVRSPNTDSVTIPFVNESLKIVRTKGSLDDRIEAAVDTIVDSAASEPIDLNIVHRAGVEMKGRSCDWEDAKNYYTDLLQTVYGDMNIEGRMVETPEKFGLAKSKPHILDLPKKLVQSENMRSVLDGETRPYSSFTIPHIPPNQLSVFRIVFTIKVNDEAYSRLVSICAGTSIKYKIYGTEEIKNGIENVDLNLFDKSKRYRSVYDDYIKNSIIVPQTYNVIAVDARSSEQIDPLAPLQENDCLKLYRDFKRAFRTHNYYFFHMKTPQSFMIKLIAAYQKENSSRG